MAGRAECCEAFISPPELTGRLDRRIHMVAQASKTKLSFPKDKPLLMPSWPIFTGWNKSHGQAQHQCGRTLHKVVSIRRLRWLGATKCNDHSGIFFISIHQGGNCSALQQGGGASFLTSLFFEGNYGSQWFQPRMKLLSEVPSEDHGEVRLHGSPTAASAGGSAASGVCSFAHVLVFTEWIIPDVHFAVWSFVFIWFYFLNTGWTRSCWTWFFPLRFCFESFMCL